MPEQDALSKIAQSTAKRIAALREEFPLEALRKTALYKRKPKSFEDPLIGKGGRKLIAEIKFASPSAGKLADGSAERAVEIAGGYLKAGACALSILTEPDFFKGDWRYLAAVREAHPKARLLMKDFFVDSYQFDLARAAGADAALLIVALLGPRLKEMLKECAARGLTPLVEVHTKAELDAALATDAPVIGVNSRDLRTLKTDLETTKALAEAAKEGKRMLVAESGISKSDQIMDLEKAGYHAFLVGSHLMSQPDPGAALKELLSR